MSNFHEQQISILEQILETLKNHHLSTLLNEKEFFTFDEACLYLGVSNSTLYAYNTKRLIPFYKSNGRKLYYKKSDLDSFILDESNRYKSNAEIESEAATKVLTGCERRRAC